MCAVVLSSVALNAHVFWIFFGCPSACSSLVATHFFQFYSKENENPVQDCVLEGFIEDKNYNGVS